MTTPVFLYLSETPLDFKKLHNFLGQEKVLCIDGALGDGWCGAKERADVAAVLSGQVPLSALIRSLNLKKWDVLEGMNHTIKFKMLDEFKKKDLWDDLFILKKHYQSLIIYAGFEESNLSFYLKQNITAVWMDMPTSVMNAVVVLNRLKKLQNLYQGEVYFLNAEKPIGQSVQNFLQTEIKNFEKLTCYFGEGYSEWNKGKK